MLRCMRSITRTTSPIFRRSGRTALPERGRRCIYRRSRSRRGNLKRTRSRRSRCSVRSRRRVRFPPTPFAGLDCRSAAAALLHIAWVADRNGTCALQERERSDSEEGAAHAPARERAKVKGVSPRCGAEPRAPACQVEGVRRCTPRSTARGCQTCQTVSRRRAAPLRAGDSASGARRAPQAPGHLGGGQLRRGGGGTAAPAGERGRGRRPGATVSAKKTGLSRVAVAPGGQRSLAAPWRGGRRPLATCRVERAARDGGCARGTDELAHAPGTGPREVPPLPLVLTGHVSSLPPY